MTDEPPADSSTDADLNRGRKEAIDHAPPVEALSDLESLIDREDVDFREETLVVDHQHHFDTYDPIEGMAVVGVTNGEGEVLLLVHDDASHALLPHGPVEPGEDWKVAASREVEEMTGVAVEIDGVQRVKRKYFSPEGDDDRQTTARQVFFHASPKGDETVADDPAIGDGDDWNAGWFDEIPVDTDEGNEETLNDARSFLD